MKINLRSLLILICLIIIAVLLFNRPAEKTAISIVGSEASQELLAQVKELTKQLREQQNSLSKLKAENERLNARVNHLEQVSEMQVRPVIPMRAKQAPVDPRALEQQKKEMIAEETKKLQSAVDKVRAALKLKGFKAKRMDEIAEKMVKQLVQLSGAEILPEEMQKKRLWILQQTDKSIKSTLSSSEYQKYTKLVGQMRNQK